MTERKSRNPVLANCLFHWRFSYYQTPATGKHINLRFGISFELIIVQNGYGSTIRNEEATIDVVGRALSRQ